MAEGNRVVESLRKIADLRVDLEKAQQESSEASLRAGQAHKAIHHILQQVEWGVSTNKPTRVIQVDGAIYTIRYVTDQNPTVERLVVEVVA